MVQRVNKDLQAGAVLRNDRGWGVGRRCPILGRWEWIELTAMSQQAALNQATSAVQRLVLLSASRHQQQAEEMQKQATMLVALAIGLEATFL